MNSPCIKNFQRNKVIDKKHFTLALILNEVTQEVLLGLKKRGFGLEFWNGFGGKVEQGENIIDAAIREVKEECSLDVNFTEELAQIELEFTNNPGHILVTHAFKTSTFSGNVTESEEMLPKWWSLNEIPYDQMWPDSKIWHRYIFAKKKFTAYFLYDEFKRIIHYELKECNRSGESLKFNE